VRRERRAPTHSAGDRAEVCQPTISVTGRRFRGRHYQGRVIIERSLPYMIQLAFVLPRYGSIKPKETTPTTLFGCYTPGNARVTRIVREMSSAPRFLHPARKQGKHTQNGVDTEYEVSPSKKWRCDSYYTSAHIRRSMSGQWKVSPKTRSKQARSTNPTFHRFWTEIIDVSIRCPVLYPSGLLIAYTVQDASCTAVSQGNFPISFLRGNPEFDLRRRLRRRPYPPWQTKCASPSDCFFQR
jgi:hypothetical protein